MIELFAVMNICCGEHHRQRNPVLVYDHMTFGTELARSLKFSPIVALSREPCQGLSIEAV
jgi:hypothetical protein